MVSWKIFFISNGHCIVHLLLLNKNKKNLFSIFYFQKFPELRRRISFKARNSVIYQELQRSPECGHLLLTNNSGKWSKLPTEKKFRGGNISEKKVRCEKSNKKKGGGKGYGILYGRWFRIFDVDFFFLLKMFFFLSLFFDKKSLLRKEKDRFWFFFFLGTGRVERKWFRALY